MPADFWVPLMMVERFVVFRHPGELGEDPGTTRLTRRGSRWLFVKGRLKDGRAIEEARAQLETLYARLRAEYPPTNKDVTVNVVPAAGVRFHPMLDGYFDAASGGLTGAVALVLLVACGNVAEPAAGARHARQARAGHPRRYWRQPRPLDSAIAGRRPRAGSGRRRAGSRDRLVGGRRAARADCDGRVPDPRQLRIRDRSHGAAVRRGGDRDHGAGLRAGAGVVGFASGAGAGAESIRRRRRRDALLGARRARGRAARVVGRPARRRRVAGARPGRRRTAPTWLRPAAAVVAHVQPRDERLRRRALPRFASARSRRCGRCPAWSRFDGDPPAAVARHQHGRHSHAGPSHRGGTGNTDRRRGVGPEYFTTVNVPIVAGRAFTREDVCSSGAC